MRSAIFVAALVAAVSAQLRIETPQGATECQPARIMWSGGTAPYYPAVIPGGQPSAAALKSFPQTNDMALTWTVDIAAGTRITMRITDGTGAVNYAEQVTIQAGSNKSCLSSSTTGNSTAASGSPGASAAIAAPSSASAAAASGAASGASSASGAASTARAASSSTASGLSASASSAGNAAASTARTGAAAASSSAAAAFPGAEPRVVGGLLAVAAGVFGVLAI